MYWPVENLKTKRTDKLTWCKKVCKIGCLSTYSIMISNILRVCIHDEAHFFHASPLFYSKPLYHLHAKQIPDFYKMPVTSIISVLNTRLIKYLSTRHFFNGFGLYGVFWNECNVYNRGRSVSFTKRYCAWLHVLEIISYFVWSHD